VAYAGHGQLHQLAGGDGSLKHSALDSPRRPAYAGLFLCDK
jgi:hypothetical protein